MRSVIVENLGKIMKPVTEASYMTAENAFRYRVITRFLYEQYERMTYWVSTIEVYEYMVRIAEFSSYTIEQCKQDMKALENWKNVIPIQDTKKATTIESFKNKQFRYQLTEYTVEMERMLIRLENLEIEGASLEPTLLERIKQELDKLEAMALGTPAQAYSWWSSLNNDFIRLNQNYQDYMRELNSVKAQEMMKTREFLLFKGRLIDYLRSFVVALQDNTEIIERRLRLTDKAKLEMLFHNIFAYEKSIPRLEVLLSDAEILERIRGRWRSIEMWFVAEDGKNSESGRLFEATNEIIRRITRYANNISMLAAGNINRKEDYRYLCGLFRRADSVTEAHRLSAVVFGVERPLHLRSDEMRATDSINSGVFEENPFVVNVQPRTRKHRESHERSPIGDFSAEKERLKAELRQSEQREQELIERYIVNDKLNLSTLPIIESEVRRVILQWLSKALETKEAVGRTAAGKVYRVTRLKSPARCVLRCADGEMEMPAYELVFADEAGRSVL